MGALKRRALGRDGPPVAELGLGAMDTPTSPDGLAAIHAAIAEGVEVIDTAREYAGSEALIGRALREGAPAHTLRLVSKTFSRTVHGAQYDVDRSLRTLGVERIGLYLLHDVSTPEAWEAATGADGALEGLRAARERGLVEGVGLSSHSMEVLERAIGGGRFDAVMLEYSAFFPATAPLIDLARERGVGVIVMRPLGGSGRTSAMRGRIAGGYDGPLTPANLLRYVWSNAGVSVAIPGARRPAHVRANAATARAWTPLDAGERRALEAEAARLY